MPEQDERMADLEHAMKTLVEFMQTHQQWAIPIVFAVAFAECVALIDESGVDWHKVVFHCFSEGPEEIALLNQRGGRGSFTGILTYPSAANIRHAALAQGLDRLMLETDSPYLSPQPVRGQPNQPAHLRHTAEKAAEIFGISLDQLAARTTANTKAFFGLK